MIHIRTIMSMAKSINNSMNQSNKISQSVYDLFEQHLPGHYILNIIPNDTYKDYSIYQDLMKGVRATKFNTEIECCNYGCRDCKGKCENILDYKVEDILAMKLHSSYYSTYNLDSDEAAAKHLYSLLFN
jgi:hypothetical protein